MSSLRSRASSATPFLGVLLVTVLAACQPDRPPAGQVDSAPRETPEAHRPTLIPAPTQLTLRAGALAIDPASRVAAEGGEAAQSAAQRLIALTQQLHGVTLSHDGTAAAAIVFALEPDAGLTPEGYRLVIEGTQARAIASDAAGLFHAATSLALLMQSSEGRAVQLPQLSIEDAPRFAWRGLMLDSARHAQSVEEIKHLIDAMALHKLNVLHWHLSDDQGWRIEIKRFPRLTEIGGCRVPAGAAGRDAVTGEVRPYCAWYSQDQIRDIVAYAQARHIEIVPEIDLPGHAQAAVAAYPDWGVLDEVLPVSPDWGVHSVLFNVEEPTLDALQAIFDEVVELFPGRFVHVGGDEAVKDQWRASDRVQSRMRELGITDEAALQTWMIQRMERHLAARGRRLIGWDEILEEGLPSAAAVMSWRGIEGGLQAAGQGHDVVMSPSSDLYFDYLQSASSNEAPGRPAMIPLARVYAFEPVPVELAADRRHHILGLQANVWTEHLRFYERVQHAFFPRIAAVAERAWSRAEQRDFNDFAQRLNSLLKAYRALDIGYANTGFEVQAKTQLLPGLAQARVQLLTPNGFDIHYTLDGSAPGPDSPRYTSEFEVTLPSTLKTIAVAGGRALPVTTELLLDAERLSRRDSTQLMPEPARLMLRLEDDTARDPADPHSRAIFNVDIFEPRWEWKASPVGQGDRVRVRAARIPYNFQLHHEESHRRFLPATHPNGELRIQQGCEGAVLAEQTLPADTEADGFVSLDLELAAGAAPTDLCLQFTGDTRPQIWVIDRVELLPQAGRNEARP